MAFYNESEPASEPSFWFANKLSVPLIPPALHDQHQMFHPNHVGTLLEPDPESDYMLKPSIKFLSQPVPDHYVLSFWGHGANSYSANFRLAYGDVAVLFQIGFGAYQDPESCGNSWNVAVAGIDAFLSEIITVPSGEPRERNTMVAFSDFRDFDAGGSGPTIYSRGLDNLWAPQFTYASWGELRREPSED
jgi:hypothetical protein